MSIPIVYPYVFFLIFVRGVSFFMAAPVFNQRSVPVQAKIGLAALLAFLLAPSAPAVDLPANDLAFFTLVVQEVLIGLLLGFTAMLPLWAVGLVGRFMASAMGMSYATSISPLFPETSPPMGQFFLHFALLLFLVVRADHVLLLGLKQLLILLPPGYLLTHVLTTSGDLFMARMLFFTGRLWTVSLQIALPVIGVILLSDVALVLIGKAMPRMNIFAQSLPLKVLMGLVAVLFSLPYFWPVIAQEVNRAGEQMLLLFK